MQFVSENLNSYPLSGNETKCIECPYNKYVFCVIHVLLHLSSVYTLRINLYVKDKG